MNELVVGIKLTADGKSARAEIVGIDGALGKLEGSGNRAKTGLDNAGRGAEEARRRMEAAARSAGALVGAFVGLSSAAIVRSFVQSADAIKGIEARIRLVSGTTAEYQRGLHGVTEVAYRYNQQLDDTAKLYGRIAPVAQDLHRSQADVLKIMSGVGAAMRVSNASAAEQSSTITQLTQTLSSATAQWEDFGQLQDTAPALVRAVEKELAGLVAQHGSLKAAMAAGAISQEQFFETLVRVAPEFERQAATIDGPVSGSLTNLKTSLAEASAAMDKVLGVTGKLSEMFNGLAGAVKNAAEFWKSAFPSSAAADQVEAFERKMVALQERIQSEKDKPLAFLNTEKIARMEQALQDMESAYESLQKTAQESAKAGTEAFQGLGYSVEDVGRKQDATISALSAAAKKYGIPENVLVTVAKLESNFNQAAVSAKGALGVMQLMPGTAKELGVNARDAMQNIDGGARYLKKMLDMFKKDVPSALAAYNMGPGNFQRYGLGSQAAQDYLAAYDKAAKQLKAKYPNGLLADVLDTKEQQRLQSAARDSFVSHLQAIEQASKASAERQKGSLDTQIAEREAALRRLQEASKLDIAGKTGGERTDAVQRAYEQERQALQQIALLKGHQVALDEAAARAALQTIQQQIDAADRFQLTEAQRQALQGQKVQAETALAVLAEQRAQREIEAGQKIAQAYDAVAEAKAKQNGEDQQAIAALDTYIARMGEKIQSLAEGNQLLSEEAELRKLIAGLPAGMDAGKQVEQAGRLLTQYKELTKAAGDKKKAEQAVSDSILRQGQYYQAMSQMAQKAAKGMAEAFGDTGKAIGGMVVAIADANQYMFQIQQQTAAQIKEINEGDGTKDEKAQKVRTAEMQGQTQELAAQLNLYGSVATAAQGFFEKGSSGYKAMQTASQAFHAAEMAASIAATAQKAIEAITTQASAGPYIGFALMAAMAAALGAIGAFKGGVSSAAPSSTSMREQSKGTVLGDSDATSESLKNSLDKLEATNSADLAYSAQMTRSLKNIEASLTGVTASLLLNVNAFTALAGKFSAGQGKIKDYGIGFPEQAIADILRGGFDVRAYTKGTPTGGSTGTYVTAAGKEVSREFTLVIQGIVDALNAGAKSFGVSGEAFRQKINDFQVQFSALSLRDEEGKALKGDELKAAIEGYFSSVADQITSSLHIDGLEQFQVAGEGLFETFVRLAGSIDESSVKLAALGVDAVNYRDIELKRAQDLSAEIARQSIVATEGGSAIGTYIQGAVGSIDDLIEAYKGLLVISDQMKTFGLNANNLTRDMVNAAGGVKALGSAMESFASNFYNDGEQVSAQFKTLSREFSDFGVAMPKNKEAFRSMIEGIDTSSQAGQELFGHMISLADAFAQAADKAEDLEKKYAKYTNPFAGANDQIDQIITDFQAILDYKLGIIRADFDNKASIAKHEANDPIQAKIDSIKGAVGTRSVEVSQDYAYISQSLTRITELQGLIDTAMRSGNKKAVAFVQGWQAEIDGLNSNISTLYSDIAGKSAEIETLNREIDALNQQIATNSANIDTAQLQEKLTALTTTRKQIMEQQGEVIIETMRQIWEDMLQGFKDASNSINQQIAQLKGPKAVAKLARSNERDAIGDLNDYIGRKNHDPAKALEKIATAQGAIMDNYNAQLEILTRRMEREARPKIREIREDARDQKREIRADARGQKRAIQDAADARLEALHARTQARIASITNQMNAAIEALADLHQAEMDALQDAQNARMKALKKEQDEATKALQKRQKTEMEALQKQMQSAEALKNAYAQIAEHVKALRVGQYSPLSPQDQLAEARRQYEELLAKARAGDPEAAAKLSQASDAYLQLAQRFFGSGADYARIFAEVTGALEQLGGTAVSVDPVQAAVESLQESQERELEALREAQEKASEDLQRTFRDEQRELSRAQQKASEALRETFQSRIDAVNQQAQTIERRIQETTQRKLDKIDRQTDRQLAKIDRATERQIAALTDPNKNEAIRQLKDRTIAKLEHLGDIVDRERKKALEQIKEQIDHIKDLKVLNRRQLRELNHIAEKMGAPTVDVPAFAAGGVAPGGVAWVGERGPEPVFLPAGARVVSNAEARSALGNSDSRIVEKLDAVIRELRALVTTQSSANPRLVGAVEGLADETAKMRRDQKIRPVAKA